GVIRSFESLARAVGPLLGGYLYWTLNVGGAYLVLALMLGVTLLMAVRLHDVRKGKTA
ncbi:MAG: hypothetical protein HY042_12340, partial [Spirochaetia bacterium]|nr:hypothetical protein [Spirochaetia bacterium]